MWLKLGLFTLATIFVSSQSCSTNNAGQSTGSVYLSQASGPPPTAPPSGYTPPPSPPATTPPPTMTPTPFPTIGYKVMMGSDLACGSTSHGSFANPGNANPSLNSNVTAALIGTHPIIIVNEVSGQTSPYTIPCTPPTNWGATYLLRFASYADLVTQAAIPGVIPTDSGGAPRFAQIQYDSEKNQGTPSTPVNEIPTNGGSIQIPGYYYYSFSQAVAGLTGPPIFQATEGIAESNTAQQNVLYGTGSYWRAWANQSQQQGSSVASWVADWGPQAASVLSYNNTLPVYLGVGTVLAGTPITAGTQAQLDAVMANVPPNFAGVWMNCGSVTKGGVTVPLEYGICAQAVVDTALNGVQATPYPIPASTIANPGPPPAPTPTPTQTPTPAPVIAVTPPAPFHTNARSQIVTFTTTVTPPTFSLGDLLVYGITFGTAAGDPTAPPSWNEVPSCGANSLSGVAGDVYTHVVTSGDVSGGGNYTFGFPGTSGPSSGMLYDTQNGTYVTANATNGNSTATGGVTGATVNAYAPDATLAFFGVADGTVANDVTPRSIAAPFFNPALTQAATANSTFSANSAAAGALTPTGSLGGPFGGATPPPPNPYYVGPYVNCTVVVHVPSDPTPTPPPSTPTPLGTPAVFLAAPWNYANKPGLPGTVPTPRPFTNSGATTQVTVIASYEGPANPLGGTVADLLNSWSLEAGKTDSSATTGGPTDAHSYDPANSAQAFPAFNLVAGTTYVLALVQNNAQLKFEYCAGPSYSCTVVNTTDTNPLAINTAGLLGGSGIGVRILQGDIWNFQIYNGALTDAQIQNIANNASPDPYPSPTSTPTQAATTPPPTQPPGQAYDSTTNNNPGAGQFVGSQGFFPGWPGWQQLPTNPVFIPTVANNVWNANQCSPQPNNTPCTSGGNTFFHQLVISENGADGNDGSFPYTFINSDGQSLTISCDAPTGFALYVCQNYSNPNPGQGNISLNHALVQNTNGYTESSCPAGVLGEGSTDGHIICIDQNRTIAGHHGVELGTWLAGGTHCTPTSYGTCRNPPQSGTTWSLGAAEYCALDGDGTACDGGNATNTAGSLGNVRPEDLLYCMTGGGSGDKNCVLPYALRMEPGCNGPGYVFPASTSDNQCYQSPFVDSNGHHGTAPGTPGYVYGMGVPEGTRGCINMTDDQINALYNKNQLAQERTGQWEAGGSTWESVQYRTMDCSHFGFFNLDTGYLPSGSYYMPQQGGQPYYLYSNTGSTDPWRLVAAATPNGPNPSVDMYFTYSMTNPPVLWCATNGGSGNTLGLVGLADGLCDGGGKPLP